MYHNLFSSIHHRVEREGEQRKKQSPSKILFFKHLCWIARSTFSSLLFWPFGNLTVDNKHEPKAKSSNHRGHVHFCISRGSDIFSSCSLCLACWQLSLPIRHLSLFLCPHTFGTQCCSVFTCTFTNFVWIHTLACAVVCSQTETQLKYVEWTFACPYRQTRTTTAERQKKKLKQKFYDVSARCGKWWRKKATEMKWFHISRLNRIQLESHMLCAIVCRCTVQTVEPVPTWYSTHFPKPRFRRQSNRPWCRYRTTYACLMMKNATITDRQFPKETEKKTNRWNYRWMDGVAETDGFEKREKLMSETTWSLVAANLSATFMQTEHNDRHKHAAGLRFWIAIPFSFFHFSRENENGWHTMETVMLCWSNTLDEWGRKFQYTANALLSTVHSHNSKQFTLHLISSHLSVCRLPSMNIAHHSSCRLPSHQCSQKR